MFPHPASSESSLHWGREPVAPAAYGPVDHASPPGGPRPPNPAPCVSRRDTEHADPDISSQLWGTSPIPGRAHTRVVPGIAPLWRLSLSPEAFLRPSLCCSILGARETQAWFSVPSLAREGLHTWVAGGLCSSWALRSTLMLRPRAPFHCKTLARLAGVGELEGRGLNLFIDSLHSVAHSVCRWFLHLSMLADMSLKCICLCPLGTAKTHRGE